METIRYRNGKCVCGVYGGMHVRAREPTLSCYTKRQITEQLIVQSHGSIYGVGP